ncbi:MAG TPA: hypothetical protein VF576_12850 [Rubricoccaceae bacterium]|jgi:hypothetical protein
MRPYFARFLQPAREGANDQGQNAGLSRADVEAIAKEAVKRVAGSADKPDLAALAALVADEKEKTAAARKEAAELRKKLPAEGAVVLTGDAAKRFNDLKGREGYADDPIGKALADLDANGTALKEVADLRTQTAQDEAFRAAGLDPAKVRKYLPGLDARMEGDGDARKPVLVTKGADGKETLKDLAEALKTDHAEIAPVLAGTAEHGAGGGPLARRGGATATALPQRAASTGPNQKATDEDVQRAQRKTLHIGL